MDMIDTVLFSDVHLGSPVSRAYELLNTLKEYRFKRLIIAGDMFEDLNFKCLTSTHWELLEHIGKLSRRDVEVIWIEGNHDAQVIQFMSHLIGIPVRKEYEWELHGRKFLVTHGHQFDRFICNNVFWGNLLAACYTAFQRRISSRMLDFAVVKISDRWLRISEQVAERAIDQAKKKRADVVICGHTHFVYDIQTEDISYFNLGCWNNTPSHLLLVQQNGEAVYRNVA